MNERGEKVTKRLELERELRNAGFECMGGARHDKFVNGSGAVVMLPRHTEINEFTARQIRREAGILRPR